MPDQDLLVRIGANVRRLREQHKLTQKQLGELVGLSRSSIANMETGRQGNIAITAMVALAAALNTDVQGLISAPPVVPHPSQWLELARRVTESQRTYANLADGCWQGHEYLQGVRYRGIAEGLEMARNHHLAVVGGDSHG